MRVSREKAAENRRAIVENAARLFREKGVAAVGVDELAAAAGLSYGGLYSQFGSKDNLTAEAMDQAFLAFAERMAGNQDLVAYVTAYLSPEHRDGRGEGCVVSALGGEIPRHTESVRARFTAGIKRSHERIRGLFGKTRGTPATPDEGWSTLASTSPRCPIASCAPPARRSCAARRLGRPVSASRAPARRASGSPRARARCTRRRAGSAR